MANTPSLRDVAQAAGVSLATASRALNNKTHVQATTRALVLKAAADLGYKVQMRVAASAVPTMLSTIGVLIKRDPFGQSRLDPFYYNVLCGIEDECQRLGLNLMYASLPVDEFSHASTWSPLLENGEVDALAIVGIVFTDPVVIKRIPSHIPVIVVDGNASGLDCDTITTNNVDGAYRAVSTLIERGHRHIGLIGASATTTLHPSIRDRRDAYLNALADHGIAETYIEDSIMSPQSAYNATLNLIQRAPQVSAIFACNDLLAEHTVRAVKDAGLRVPEDVSVLGFDNTDESVNCRPPVTTVHVDRDLMGKLTVRQLCERAADPNRVSINLQMGTKLIERESIAPHSEKEHSANAEKQP
jgi:LacI family transcriptional regulator